MTAEHPVCFEACSAVLRAGMAAMAVEVTVSTLPPIIETPYDQQPFVCPHGVTYHMAPTSEQIAIWASAGER